MSESFEDILDICIDRITQGESVEDCLKSYPEKADYLEPLLKAALSARESYSAIKLRPEFERVAKYRFQSALKEKTKGGAAKRSSIPIWRHGWVMIAVAILVLFIAGGGTVAAASNSLPGESLYSVKIATEKVQGFFTFGKEAKANFYIKLGERRLDEMERLEEKNRNIPDSLLEAMNSEVERAIEILNKRDVVKEEVVSKLMNLTSNQKATLERVRANVPANARSKIEEAIERSQSSHNSAISLREMVPGLQKRTPSSTKGNNTPHSRNNIPLKLVPDLSMRMNNNGIDDVEGETRAWGTLVKQYGIK